MKLSFHGANRSVTGSCHLVECRGMRLLVDCGLYQGSRELALENAEDFGFLPTSVDIVLITHAHLDHCGRLPLLYKRGFRGEVIATAATKELARVIMLDAGHLAEEEALHQNKRLDPNESPIAPLYTVLDALNTMDHFGRVATYGTTLPLATGIKATFVDAGHILGSASILLELEEDGNTCSIFFSGDIGNAGRPLLRPPEVRKADVVVMEATYGDRVHKPLKASVEELYRVVRETFERKGNVVIPTFALERAQELLYYLREGVENGMLPTHPKVFLDSPMAISATEIFKHHPESYNEEMKTMFDGDVDPFALPGLQFTRHPSDSMAINDIPSGCIIMAGSGMCSGGRIRYHINNNITRKECSIVFVGFAAIGTLARTIIDGAKSIMLFGIEIPVLAHIYTIGGFSAHADQQELLDWHHKTKCKRTFLVHAEEAVMKTFANKLTGSKVFMPKPGEEFEL